MNDKPVAVDLYCCQGGNTRGLQDAGFHVIGVDIEDQPRYCGDEFYQADAIAWLDVHREWVRSNVTIIGGSPPCQRYTLCQRIQGREHPDLISPTRYAMQQTGVPYVIENVWEARHELRNPVLLCGSMFGLNTDRHRLFETGGWSFEAPEHPDCRAVPTVKMGRPVKPGDKYHAVGNFSGVDYVRADMGVPWMNRDGIRESIPPAYGEYVGRSFLAELERRAAA
jgi:DNA (cytosine-5)-methyltransferase 1